MKCFKAYLESLTILCGIFLLLGLSSCEEVIEPSLITAAPVLVVEGEVSNLPRNSRIRLTETTAFNDPNPNPKVMGANVSLVNSGGFVSSFKEVAPGEYMPLDSTFVGLPGELYSLRINTENNEEYQGVSRMPSPLPIDSVTYEYDSTNIYAGNPPYYVYYHYQDPVGPNYHLVEIWVNGDAAEGNRFEIRSDENVRGKYLRLELPQLFHPSDTVKIQLQTINSNVFRYYEGLNSLIESGSPSEAVPENPNNNISGDAPALGIFQASYTEEFEVILPER